VSLPLESPKLLDLKGYIDLYWVFGFSLDEVGDGISIPPLFSLLNSFLSLLSRFKLPPKFLQRRVVTRGLVERKRIPLGPNGGSPMFFYEFER
jgi:hypothetical protein